jgi:hypothetical protein
MSNKKNLSMLFSVIASITALFSGCAAGTLDMSALSGYILFESPVWAAHPDYGIWRLDPATGDTDVLLRLNDYGQNPRYMSDFAYSPEDETIIVTTEEEDENKLGHDHTVFAKFTRTEEGAYKRTVYEYGMPAYISQIAYVPPKNRMMLNRIVPGEDRDELVFLNPGTGEPENPVYLPERIHFADWNADFTELIADSGIGRRLYLIDVESGAAEDTGLHHVTQPQYAEGYNEIVYEKNSNLGNAVCKYNLDTGEETELYHFKERLWGPEYSNDISVSPDKKYVVAYVFKMRSFTNSHIVREYITVIEIATGNSKIVYSKPYDNGLIDNILWVDENHEQK